MRMRLLEELAREVSRGYDASCHTGCQGLAAEAAGVCGLTRLSRRQSLGFLFYRGNRGSSWPWVEWRDDLPLAAVFRPQRWA